jgi:hypothetical protein
VGISTPKLVRNKNLDNYFCCWSSLLMQSRYVLFLELYRNFPTKKNDVAKVAKCTEHNLTYGCSPLEISFKIAVSFFGRIILEKKAKKMLLE